MKKKLKNKWNRHIKNFAKAVAQAIIALLCISCGTTKVSVQKPAEGTSTTITVTTNNPITTTTNPATEVKL